MATSTEAEVVVIHGSHVYFNGRLALRIGENRYRFLNDTTMRFSEEKVMKITGAQLVDVYNHFRPEGAKAIKKFRDVPTAWARLAALGIGETEVAKFLSPDDIPTKKDDATTDEVSHTDDTSPPPQEENDMAKKKAPKKNGRGRAPKFTDDQKIHLLETDARTPARGFAADVWAACKSGVKVGTVRAKIDDERTNAYLKSFVERGLIEVA